MLSGNADLETLSTAIIGLSGSSEERPELLRLLSENSTLISSKPAVLLTALSFQEHSLACLHVLWSWKSNVGSASRRGDIEWFNYAIRFLKECDPAPLDSVGAKFLSVARGVKKEAIQMGQPRLAILPLRCAVQKFAPAPDHLTPLHADFFQICLLAGNYTAAKEVLFTEVYEMDPARTNLTPTDFLLYCYYGGRLCVGLKCHRRALELFHLALVAPTLTSNAIALMIYKLYTLVCLLEMGSVPELPKYSSNSVLRLARMPAMTPYLRLVEAYQDSSRAAVEKVMRDCKDVYEEDNCLGLVKQVVASLSKRDVKMLTESYMTRSLSDIANVAGEASERATERLILQLVKGKHISAQIHGPRRMVTFVEDEGLYDGAETTQQLDAMIQEVMQLGERMQKVKDNIELDPEYRNKVLQTKQHSKLDC